MTQATGGSRPGRTRVAVILAVVLAVVGAVLITLAVKGSRPGAPQPTAAQAGSINPAGTAAAGTPAAGSGVSSPVGTGANSVPAATTGTAAPTTATPTSKSAAPTTAKTVPTTPATTAPVKTAPSTPKKTTPIVLPSFSNPAKGLLLQTSAPVSLAIPALGVTSPMLTLGLNPDGTVQVPSLDDPDSKAGWYKGSPTPGSIGPAIILGHIDSKKYGPGVFYKIGSLSPGQEVDVTRQDGTVAVFTVDGVRSYPKDQFPTKDVYGNIDHAGLRLITCGGTFDPNKGSYESNIVVYASLKSSHKA